MKINKIISIIIACVLGLSISACVQKTPPIIVQQPDQQIINTPGPNNSGDQQNNGSQNNGQQNNGGQTSNDQNNGQQNNGGQTNNDQNNVDTQLANWDGKSDVTETSYVISDL